jgi:hypothetical protein
VGPNSYLHPHLNCFVPGRGNYLQNLLNPRRKTHLKSGFSSKKEILNSLVLFERRGPPKNEKTIYKQH